MEINFNDLVGENGVDECEQISNIAKKSWLSGAAVSLAHLDAVKPNVYNFGISEPRDLKATNLRARKLSPAPDPPLSATSSKLSTAWGSNSSIPDLLRLQNADKATLPKPTRPASAKYSNTSRLRPPSGKKPRPQSAKEPTSDVVSEEAQPGFGVKGARYDPSGRPPKGVPNMTTTGWVGPPAGLKYPDRPAPGSDWKIEFPVQAEEEGGGVSGEAEREVPPPPCTTPIPQSPEPDRPKRVFELYIGDPYSVTGQDEEDDLYENSDDEMTYIRTSSSGQNLNNNNETDVSSANQNNSNAHYAGNSAPSLRLADQKESLRLDLPMAEDDYDEIDEVDTDRLLAEAESVSEKFDLKRIINANRNLPDMSSPSAEHEDDHPTPSDDFSETPHRQRAENLVDAIVTESGLAFDTNNRRNDASKKPVLEHEKSSVKFKDDVTTVDITPRNIGRKVDEIHNKKKMFVPKDSGFIDLIEVKNRMEPVLSMTKMDVSPSRTRPPSGKSKPAKSVTSPGMAGKHTDTRTDRPVSPNHCLRNQNHATPPRPRSGEPLNRPAKPVTTVTVDYGEEATEDKTAKSKKKRKKFDDVVTMMEQVNLQDTNSVPDLNLQDFDDFNKALNDFLPETKCKSEPEKNYYEISRHSSMSNRSTKEEVEKVVHKTHVLNTTVHKTHVLNTAVHKTHVLNKPVSTVVKTTKTIEFDEVQPKETTVKSVIDAHMVNKEAKEFKVKPPSRPSSAKPPPKKPVKVDEPDPPERPGSRLGFVAMAPGGNKENQNKNKPWSQSSTARAHRRPSSAKPRLERSGKKAEQPDLTEGKKAVQPDLTEGDKVEQPDLTEGEKAEQPDLTEGEKAEREKVIDNLLERTKSLQEGGEKEETDATPPMPEPVEKKKVRPYSAHVGIVSRAKEHNHCKSAATRRPVSATTSRLNHKHGAGHSSSGLSKGRTKSAGKSKTVYTEPCIINTNTPYLDDESETEEDLACQEMHKQLREKGVNIAPDTLHRALYPPTGRTKYYHITADLPQKSSITLLSHPREWLGEEYRRLQKAEKTLAKANEIMFLQERAEKRRAMLEAKANEIMFLQERAEKRRAMLEGLTPEERKKALKKKGKKATKKLRRSKTIA